MAEAHLLAIAATTIRTDRRYHKPTIRLLTRLEQHPETVRIRTLNVSISCVRELPGYCEADVFHLFLPFFLLLLLLLLLSTQTGDTRTTSLSGTSLSCTSNNNSKLETVHRQAPQLPALRDDKPHPNLHGVEFTLHILTR